MASGERVRWRGGQVTRIEALTDAVFGFAITLLVVSLEVPQNFAQLENTMRGFVAFACSFALLILVWTYHYYLFSRYDLDDGFTIFWNSVLLFVVLFFVYPLKFVFTSWLAPGAAPIFTEWEQLRTMMSIYGGGFVAVFLVFAVLYHHAYALRERLDLDDDAAIAALGHVANCLVMCVIGLVSIAVAQLAPLQWSAPLSGMTYFLIGPMQYLVGAAFARRRERRRAALATAPAAAGPPARDGR